ncbi:MAG: hypothetical protein ABI443_09350 [Chthoniobacterales bacterium]
MYRLTGYHRSRGIIQSRLFTYSGNLSGTPTLDTATVKGFTFGSLVAPDGVVKLTKVKAASTDPSKDAAK